MGVGDLNPSNEYYKDISYPINFTNIESSKVLNIKIKNDNPKKINDTDNNKNNNNKSSSNIESNKINKNLSLNALLKKNEKKKKLEIKRVLNSNKINNYIHNSKTNYSYYKRVPHMKSPTTPFFPTENNPNNINNVNNSNKKTILNNQINKEENNKLWFKTHLNDFNKVKDEKDFIISEYSKKNYKNAINNINNISNDFSCKNSNFNIYNRNKNQLLNKSINKSNIIYTKALPIDYNNEKKIENFFILNNKTFKENNLLYIIERKNFINTNNNIYSTKKDYKQIIKKYSNNKFILANYLLELNERNWYYELITISNLLINKKTEKDILLNNKYLRKIIKLQEQFKWLIESIGIYFNNNIFGISKDNGCNNINMNINMNINKFNLPFKDKLKWFNGFKWKGLYIKIIPNDKRKIIINEIKALNYFYFDYLQLLEEYSYNHINQLLYHIIFPLIGYCEINGFILFASAVINIDEFSEQQNNLNSINEEITLNDIIHRNNGVINYFCGEDKIGINVNMRKQSFFWEYNIGELENKYFVKDLLKSKLFSEVNLYHFIRIFKNKFLMFNLYEFIPKLFEMKLGHNLKINYISVINNKRIYYSTKFKINSINNKSKENSKPTNLKINKTYSSPKEALSNIFNNYPSLSQLKTKDIIINNIYFRIIYGAIIIKDENNSKNKQFVDYLYNYNNYNKNITNNKSEIFVSEPYEIIYDLQDSIKLKYSLIKQLIPIEKNTTNNKINLNNILNKLYFTSTNYISYFNSWCEMLNKNSYNIKTYSDLKENMNKYGISTHLKFFSLINIYNTDITDIIKISLLIKCIKFIFNKKDNDYILDKISSTDMPFKFCEYRRTKILYIIKAILYPNEIINQSKEFFNWIYEDLVFYINVLFLKLKLIDGYLSLGLFNLNDNKNMNMDINIISKKISGFESPKSFLKHIIEIARNKPFLFLNDLEYKLKFIINPFIKFKASISIESMSNKLELKHIVLNQNGITYSYINSNEISGLILSKLIYITKNNNSHNNNGYNHSDNKNNNVNGNTNMEVLTNNNNLALKPSYMRANINLNSFKSSIKNKDNPLQISSSFSEIGANQTKKDTFRYNKYGITSEFFLPFSEKNENKNQNIQNKEINQSLLEKDICNNIIFELPSICYKMKYFLENDNNKNYNYDFNKFLKNIYFLPELKLIKTWYNSINKIFYGISSSNGDLEHNILQTLVYLFIITFFYEKNFNEANQINMKIKDIFKKGNYQLSLVDLSLINLFQALSSEKYIESEAPYSKCLMLLLMSYGEPRGRNNDSNGILAFPIWKIARKTRLEQKAVNDYFKEMFHTLSFFVKKKCFVNIYNNKSIFNYGNNVYNNIENIKIFNEIIKDININNNFNGEDLQNMSSESTISDFLNNNINENPGLDIFGNISKLSNFNVNLNQNIFDDKILNKAIIKYFKFPPVSCNTEKLDKIFFKVDFIIFILKHIQCLFRSKKTIFNEEYINEFISDEVFNPYPYNYKHLITYNSNESDTNDDYTAEESSVKKTRKFNNCEICNHKEKLKKLERNEFFIFPNKSNSIYNYIEDKKNQTVKNRIKNNDSIDTIKGNKRASIINPQICKTKEKPKNKNKSVEGIKISKNNLFSHFLYQELLQKLSHKLNIQSGVVISFGNNPHNETSHDNYDKITLPRMIFKLKNIRISHIFSGWEHNILLTNKGEIFSFGNNQNFQCGLPNKNNNDKIIKDPTNISIMNNNIRGINAACGNDHSLILANSGEVYAFGNNEDGALGINDNKLKKYEFTKINFGIYTNKIKDISAGTVHNLALTTDNKIFSWGSSQGGQLGLQENYLLSQPGYKNSYVLYTPTLVQIFSKNSKKCEEIVKIGCGEAHSIALNTTGKVYSWGFGSNGQLGLGFCEDSFEPGMGLYQSRKFTPELITYLEDEKIIDIKCGKTFTMFINNKNELFACGVNDLNQLGINEPSSKEHLIDKDITCYDFVYPTKVDCFLNMKVLKISCGEGHCLGIIKDLISNIQTIWSWGNNNFGQLGQGSIVKKSTPNPINYLSDYNSKKFDEISCGGFHSLCLIKYKENLNWIEEDYNRIRKVIDDIGII